jgi:hypothetical protein
MVIFHTYVSLPEGISPYQMVILGFHPSPSSGSSWRHPLTPGFGRCYWHVTPCHGWMPQLGDGLVQWKKKHKAYMKPYETLWNQVWHGEKWSIFHSIYILGDGHRSITRVTRDSFTHDKDSHCGMEDQKTIILMHINAICTMFWPYSTI